MISVQTKYNAKTQIDKHAQLITNQNIEGE